MKKVSRLICFSMVALVVQSPLMTSQTSPHLTDGRKTAETAESAQPSYDIHGKWMQFRLPDGAVNFAARSSGAWASASSAASGFDPNGTIDGNWTAVGWGKGHGWQNRSRHEYPSWLEIRLPREEEIDTIVIQTFPEVMRSLNWMGIRNADLQVKFKGKWETVGSQCSVRGNIKGTIVFPIPVLRTDAIRVMVLGANTGNQEDVFYDDDDFARILQVGVYHLNTPYPFSSEDLTVHVKRGRLGSIAIYRDKLPVKPLNPSSPEYLASLFLQAGYGITFLDSRALCVPEIFNHQNFDVFVDPYGAPFPVDTMLYEFLTSGGHLITLGGHPFRQALMFTPDGRLVDGGYDAGITTTVGRQSDYRLPFREQLGLFYTGYERFEDVAYSAPAPGQRAVKSSFRVTGDLEGEVAAAYVGEPLSLQDGRQLTDQGIFPVYANTARKNLANIVGVLNGVPRGANFDYRTGYLFNWPRCRWIPLVNAYDRWGRLRGSVVSLLDNFRGPYRGSGWIYCGVENEDLFAPEHPEYTQVLLDGLRFLREDLRLHDVQPEMGCYYQGETVKAATSVENYATRPRHVSVRFQFIASDSTTPIFERLTEITIPSSGSQRPSVTWRPSHFDSDFYYVRVELIESGRRIDRSESAFVVWDPKVIAQGPKVDFHDQYFHAEGRPELLIGNRTNGFQPHGQVDEDVLGWERQLAEMRDYGTKVFSPVFFSLYIPGLAWGQPQTPAVPLQLQRLMDAQVQLAQKHHLIIAPCIFFIAKRMAMENLEFSRRICEELGKRYVSVPGMMFYIYDDGDANTPLQVFHDWTAECVNGFASSGRKYMILAETGGLAMQRYGSEALSFPANGNYAPGHPALYRAMDLRVSGKSFQLSEFGVNSQGARPADIDLHTYPGLNVSGSPAGDYSVYLMEPHLLFATGGSYVLNWVWKDTAHLIFPWGVTNANDYTPTNALIAYRNEGFFLRHFRPKFKSPQVLVVLPKERLIKDGEAFVPYLHGLLDAIFEWAVQFAVVDDTDLDRVPAGARVLIYADPRYVSPEIIGKLRSRLQAGDSLFLAGDLTQTLPQGGTRQLDLFRELTGLNWISDYPPGSEVPVVPTVAPELLAPYIGHPLGTFQGDGSNVLATDSKGHALMAIHQQGSGQLFYTADAGLDGTSRALHVFLRLRAVPATPLTPKRADRYIFETDRADDGMVYTLAATHSTAGGDYAANGPWIREPESYDVRLDNQTLHLPLGAYGLSLFALRTNGSIDALEGQGNFSLGDHTLLDAQPHVMVTSLDDMPLEKSQAIAVFAVGAGNIALAADQKLDVVEAGKIDDGRFHLVEAIKSSRQGGLLTFQIDDVQARGVVLVTSSRGRERAQKLMDRILE